MKKIILICLIILVFGCTKEAIQLDLLIENEENIEIQVIDEEYVDEKYNDPSFDYISYLEFVSLGYNSMNIIGYDRDIELNYSFININGYSHYIIGSSINSRGETTYGLTFYFEKEPRRWFYSHLFSFIDIGLDYYSRSYLENMTTDTDIKIFVDFQYAIGYNASENGREAYKFNSENIIENITEYSTAGYAFTSGQIEKLDNGIMVYSRYSKETRRYYNIHEEELLDYFLKIFVEKIFSMLNRQGIITHLNEYRSNYELLKNNEEEPPLIIDILSNMTRRELAIIRNCIYANHDYSFRSEEWIIFFQKYYDTNYQGSAPEQEALNAFSVNEKWLLDMIIEIEKAK